VAVRQLDRVTLTQSRRINRPRASGGEIHAGIDASMTTSSAPGGVILDIVLAASIDGRTERAGIGSLVSENRMLRPPGFET
jgi:hypothetical protein